MRNRFRFTSPQPQRDFGQSLKTFWKATRRFMVQRPQTSAHPAPSHDSYSTKAGLYAYLPEGEEQRDWLERLYRK